MTTVTSRPFGTTADGRAVTQYSLENENGMCVQLLSYACAVQRMVISDKDGVPRDVVLGYDTIEDYERGGSFFGAFVGRFANRIKNAAFSLNGREYRLQKNAGSHHLHGVFARRVFDGEVTDGGVTFRFVSLPEEEGYPGTLTGEVRYTLTAENALVIDYTATADADTVVNLTNHSYFNLNGQDGSDVRGHQLRIDADSYTDMDAFLIPTGKINSVEGTALDFRREKPIGADIAQLTQSGGYDHNLILNGSAGKLRRFAVAKSEKTGIVLIAATTEPAIQFYTGNFIQNDTAAHGKNGVRYPRYGGFCLEAQHYPCSPNYPQFPSTVLKKGEVYRQTTAYRLSLTTSKVTPGRYDDDEEDV